MSETDAVRELVARIEKCRTISARIGAMYDAFLCGDFVLMEKKNTSAMVIAEFLVDYYTCLETCFFRISQLFENHLAAERWHSDLLEKMTLSIEGVRVAVLSDGSASDLNELMKFRHFRRYYYELEYDWDKIEYLQKVFDRVRQTVPHELHTFQEFLTQLISLED